LREQEFSSKQQIVLCKSPLVGVINYDINKVSTKIRHDKGRLALKE
jgi:hypothetical protein